MSCEASYLLLRTPARETLLSTVLSADRLRRASSNQAGGVREGGRRILRRPMQPISNRSLRGAPMAMANRRAVSGSAVRGRAAIIAAALGEGSKGLEPRSKKGGGIRKSLARGSQECAAVANRTAGSGASGLWRAGLCPAGNKEYHMEKYWCFPSPSQTKFEIGPPSNSYENLVRLDKMELDSLREKSYILSARTVAL